MSLMRMSERREKVSQEAISRVRLGCWIQKNMARREKAQIVRAK